MPPQTRRIAVVLNPVHRRADDALAAVALDCATLGLPEPSVYRTTSTSPGAAQAQLALTEGADVIVVVGGDGTVSEVAHALAGRDVPLGVMPTGTANLFAVNVGLSGLELSQLARIAVAGAPRRADLADVHLTTTAGDTDRAMLVVAGVGHDADTIADVSSHAKADAGWLSYLIAGARHLRRPAVTLDVSLDAAASAPRQVWTVLAANCGLLPSGIRVVPTAKLDDGRLHVAEVAPRGLTDWARIADSGLRRGARTPSALRYATAQRVGVASPIPRTVQIDGDLVHDVTAVEVAVRPASLRVQTRVSADTPVDVTGLSDQAIVQIIRDLHRSGLTDDESGAVLRVLEAVPAERFASVKYLLNHRGDTHDLEQLVFDDMTVPDGRALVRLIAQRAEQSGPEDDLRILCDIDDTLRSAIHDKRYPRGTVYPGIVALLNALDEGRSAASSRPGDLTFVTARPAGPADLFERYTHSGLGGLGLPKHTIMAGTLRNLLTKASMGARKIANMRRDRMLFPECRMVFLGDSGQADPQVALEVRRRFPDHVPACFIHNVTDVDADTKAEWAAQGVHTVDGWDEAARIAAEMGLISAQGLSRVETAAAAARPTHAR